MRLAQPTYVIPRVWEEGHVTGWRGERVDIYLPRRDATISIALSTAPSQICLREGVLVPIVQGVPQAEEAMLWQRLNHVPTKSTPIKNKPLFVRSHAARHRQPSHYFYGLVPILD